MKLIVIHCRRHSETSPEPIAINPARIEYVHAGHRWDDERKVDTICIEIQNGPTLYIDGATVEDVARLINEGGAA